MYIDAGIGIDNTASYTPRSPESGRLSVNYLVNGKQVVAGGAVPLHYRYTRPEPHPDVTSNPTKRRAEHGLEERGEPRCTHRWCVPCTQRPRRQVRRRHGAQRDGKHTRFGGCPHSRSEGGGVGSPLSAATPEGLPRRTKSADLIAPMVGATTGAPMALALIATVGSTRPNGGMIATPARSVRRLETNADGSPTVMRMASVETSCLCTHGFEALGGAFTLPSPGILGVRPASTSEVHPMSVRDVSFRPPGTQRARHTVNPHPRDQIRHFD